jgi:hypothetical protein
MAYRPLPLLSQVVLIAAAGTHVALMFREGQWLDAGINMARAILLLVSLLVYLVSMQQVHQRRENGGLRDLLTAVAISGAGIYMIVHAIFISKGDQRGLIFLFVPPLQWLVFAVARLLAPPARPR